MGKKSGADNVALWASKLGFNLDSDDALEVLNRVKLKSHDLKRVLTEDEFRGIIENVKVERSRS
jgi:isopropylmalate/homocitrate/citramalate synthase